MARARNIKPGLYKNEDLAECSIWARYIFAGLSTIADREGRLEDRPKRIKGELLPYDAQDMEPLLKELAARKFILRYEVVGVRYIQILTFHLHQSPHYSEKPSVIPPPDSGSHAPLKRGSKPPDSLIPDSLIPDSRSKAKLAASPLPAWIAAETWTAWVKIRPARAKTPEALLAAISKLERFRAQGHDPNEIIATSLANGWQGLFPPDQKRGGAQPSLAERNRAAADEAIRRFNEEQHGKG